MFLQPILKWRHDSYPGPGSVEEKRCTDLLPARDWLGS